MSTVYFSVAATKTILLHPLVIKGQDQGTFQSGLVIALEGNADRACVSAAYVPKHRLADLIDALKLQLEMLP